MYTSSTALWCGALLEEREGQQCQSWVFTFWDFSAAPLSRAAISTKIKDPNGAGPGGDERCRDGTLLWISNAAHVSKVMTDSQVLSQASPLRAQVIKVSYSLSLSSKTVTPRTVFSLDLEILLRRYTKSTSDSTLIESVGWQNSKQWPEWKWYCLLSKNFAYDPLLMILRGVVVGVTAMKSEHHSEEATLFSK